jgi:hypothetical protein
MNGEMLYFESLENMPPSIQTTSTTKPPVPPPAPPPPSGIRSTGGTKKAR